MMLTAWFTAAAATLILFSTLPVVALALVVPIVLGGWFSRRWTSTMVASVATSAGLLGLMAWTGQPFIPQTAMLWATLAGGLVLFLFSMGVVGHAGRLLADLQQRTADLQRAQAQLEASSAHVEAVYEATSVALIAVDQEATILSWNPGAESVFGYTRDEVVGRSLEMVASQEDGDAWAPIRYGIETGQDVPSFEGSLLHADGYILNVEARAAPMSVQGEGGAIVTIIDHTQEHAMAAALEDQEERYDSLLRNLDDAFYSLDKKSFDVLAMTAAIQEVTGYAPARFQGRADLWMGLAHPEDREAVAKHHRHAASGEVRTLRWRIRHKDGHYKWVEDRLVPVRGEEGIVRVDGRIRDIGTIVEKEIALSRAHRWIRRLEADAKAATWAFDLRSGEWYWGEGAQQLLNLGPCTLDEGPGILAALHPADAADLREAFDQARPGEMDVRIEHLGDTRLARVSWDLEPGPEGHAILVTGMLVVDSHHKAERTVMGVEATLEAALQRPLRLPDATVRTIDAEPAQTQEAPVVKTPPQGKPIALEAPADPIEPEARPKPPAATPPAAPDPTPPAPQPVPHMEPSPEVETFTPNLPPRSWQTPAKASHTEDVGPAEPRPEAPARPKAKVPAKRKDDDEGGALYGPWA